MTPKKRSALALLAMPLALVLLLILTAIAVTAQEPLPQATTGVAEWTPLGGPIAPGGQINALAVHPAIPGTVYVAVAEPGSIDTGDTRIYKTEDAAASWTLVFEPGRMVDALAVSGSNVYAGAVNPAGEGPCLYVSHDGGATWTESLSFPDSGAWIDIAVHPTDPDVALASGWLSHGGGWFRDHGLVHRTDDGGVTWTPLLDVGLLEVNVSFDAVLISPHDPNLLLAALRRDDGDSTVYRSIDGGATWDEAHTIGGASIVSFAAHGSDPQTFYAGAAGFVLSWSPNKVFRSTDAGLTWEEVLPDGGGYLAFEPPSTVYVAGDQLWASTSNGDSGSWELRSDVPHGHGSFAADLGTSPAALYAGNYGPGVFTSVDGGYGWEERNNGILSLVDVYDLDVDPVNPDRIFVAAWYAGLWRSEDAGGTWSQVLEPWPWTVAINPVDGDAVYAGGWSCWDGIIWRTDDGGATFDPLYSPPFFEPDCSGGDGGIKDVRVSPSTPDVVYGGGWVNPHFEGMQAFVVRSLDGGLSWTEVLSGPASYGIQVLAVNPLDHQVVYAGGSGCDGTCEGMIYRTTDGGGTWATVLSSPDDQVRSIVVDYVQPNIVYAATQLAKVYKSTDSGDTWDLIRPEYTGGDRLALDPNDHNRIYLGGGEGIAESPDGGQTWYAWPLSNGAPRINLGALTVDTGMPVQTLYAGFSGVWAYTRPAPTQGDRYVATSGEDELNNCTDPNNPCQTVGYALVLANPGETVRVAAGTYMENLLVDRQVTLEGGYSGPPDWTRDLVAHETVLDGSGDPTLPGDWDGEHISEPSVLYNGTEYEMWYTGSDMFGEDYIGHAAGMPGSWSKSPENPVLDDHQAFVRLDDGQYRMWYMRSGTECIWTAWSDDGLAWNEDPDPCLCPPWDGSWESDFVRDPSVALDGEGTYWMFYEGWNGAAPQQVQIGCATSPDGLAWDRCAENPILGPGPEAWDEVQVADPAVLFDGTAFHMWYAGLAVDGTWAIGYATSPDGVTWAKHEGNPVLEPTPGWWDQGNVAHPTAWFDGAAYHLWYASNSVIGHAESPDGTTWTKDIEPALSPGWFGEWGESVVTFGEGSDGGVLDGFTVTGGEACGGGGVKMQGAEATIRDCLVRDNMSLGYCGGGGVSVRASHGFATILSSEIRHNEASDGGGLDVRGGAGALISETLIYSNTARWGGGLLVDRGSSASVVSSDIQENTAAESGGGIGAWWLDTTLLISDTWIGGNTTQGNGGGVHATNGASVLMGGVTLEGNTAQGWGGGLAGYGATLTLTDVMVARNLALSGEAGGLLFMNDGTTVTLTHVAIIENEAGGGGAGLNLSGGPVATLRNVEIARNLAPWGAGLRLYEATLRGHRVSIVDNIATDNMHAAFQVDAQSDMTLTNALITGNEGGNAGLITFTSTLSLTNVTVAGNSPGYSWGGIAISDNSSASVRNSIFYSNGDMDLTCDETSDCTVEYSDLEDPWAGTGNLSANPLFVDSTSGDYHLQAGSPCIDAASAAYAPDHDIDGEARPYEGDGTGTAEPDMGADEYHGPALLCVVTSTTDSGPGTLRACLESAQAGENIAFDPVVFPPEAPVTITLTSGPLPEIWQAYLTIDGTEAGVILDGSALESGNGLHITSSGNAVQGLQILYFPENGILLDGDATDNLVGGINSTPGGPCSGQCNVISGNGWLDLFHYNCGVLVLGTRNTVSGNYVGTDATGTQAIPNHQGIHLWEATGTTVGGEVEGSANLISGNGHTGVFVWRGSSNHVVGNLIGTDASGRSRLWNLVPVGIYFDASDNIVEGNVITGEAWGIQLANSTPIDNIIRGNWIGTNAYGDDLGNGLPGIVLYSGDHTVIGPGNVIRYNDMEGIELSYLAQDTLVINNDISLNEGAGIRVFLADSLRNTIRENSIYANGGLGIDLEDGGNADLPAPILTTVDVAAGTVSGTACPYCTVEVFSDDEDEGQWYEATVTADGSGAWSFAKGSPFTATHVTATATDLDGNTSEFSVVSDIAVVGAVPFGPVAVSQPTAVRAELFNAGYQPEDGVPVTCRIEDPTSATVYEETTPSGDVAAGTWAWVTFPDWTPSAEGEHTLTCQSALPLDQGPANDLYTQSVTATAGPRPDVWTRDNDADTGDVPTDAPWWVSPDVWVRHQPDGGLVHQNPLAFAENTVYFRLRNRGDAATSGMVDIYASRSRLGWPCHVEAPNVGSIAFSNLAPDEVRIVSLTWTPEETGHHGLQTVIDALEDPPDWAQPCSPHRPRYDNNISWKNVVVYAHPPGNQRTLQAAQGAQVQVVNLYAQAKDVDLVLDWTDFPSGGSLVVALPEDLFDRWEGYAGHWVQGMEVVAATQQFVVTSPISATIGGLPMQADEVATVTLTFDGWAGAEAQVGVRERIDGQWVGGAAYMWILSDTVAPEVVATSPADAATDVALDAALVITFTEQIGPLSLQLNLTPDPGGWSIGWNQAGTVVTATHAAFASGTTYQATVTAKDAWANPMAASHSWSFATAGGWRRIHLPLVLRNR